MIDPDVFPHIDRKKEESKHRMTESAGAALKDWRTSVAQFAHAELGADPMFVGPLAVTLEFWMHQILTRGCDNIHPGVLGSCFGSGKLVESLDGSHAQACDPCLLHRALTGKTMLP